MSKKRKRKNTTFSERLLEAAKSMALAGAMLVADAKSHHRLRVF